MKKALPDHCPIIADFMSATQRNNFVESFGETENVSDAHIFQIRTGFCFINANASR